MWKKIKSCNLALHTFSYQMEDFINQEEFIWKKLPALTAFVFQDSI